nr:restriction endonuclease subunit S [Parvibacter caecicola]
MHGKGFKLDHCCLSVGRNPARFYTIDSTGEDGRRNEKEETGQPKTWEQRKLSELVERRNCFSDDKGLPRVEYEDIVSGQGALNNDVFNKNDTRGGIAFEPDDVLYGKLRPYLRNWLNPQFRGIALGDFWVLNPIGANSSFLFTLIRTPAFERVANESTGTKMPRADWQNVSSTEFAVPASREEQSRIGALFAKFDSLITLHQREHFSG